MTVQTNPTSQTSHAIIVAGGAGSRLHASAPARTPDKPLLTDCTGRRLIDTVLDACAAADCATRIVVGPPMDLPEDVLRTREDPPLAGPAAAVAAGVRVLETTGASDDDLVLLLAADLVNPGRAVTALAADGPGIGVTGGRLQPLLSAVRLADLRAATAGDLTDQPVMRILKHLGLPELPLPGGTATDIDTWQDALTHGYGRPQ